jgi:hypothetical protein
MTIDLHQCTRALCLCLSSPFPSLPLSLSRSHTLPIPLRSALCALRSAFCVLRSALCVLRSAFCALRSALCALRSVLCSLCSVLCSLRSSLPHDSNRRLWERHRHDMRATTRTSSTVSTPCVPEVKRRSLPVRSEIKLTLRLVQTTGTTTSGRGAFTGTAKQHTPRHCQCFTRPRHCSGMSTATAVQMWTASTTLTALATGTPRLSRM